MTDHIAKALRIAASQTDRNPSEAQKESGNYAKGKLRIHGMTVAIENPKGAERSGVDKGGKRWAVRMPAHYGYVLGTEGKDGDHVDVYVGPEHASGKVYVVDQIDAETGRFDEHKAFLSYPSKSAVLADYEKAFSDGKAKDRLGPVTEMTVDQFKTWVKSGSTKKPLGGGIYRGDDGMSKSNKSLSNALTVARKYANGGAVTYRDQSVTLSPPELALKGYADGGAPADPWAWRSDMDAPAPGFDIRRGEVLPPDRGPGVLKEAQPRSVRTADEAALDALFDYGPIPAKIATGIATQPVRAGEAAGRAAFDPSIPNITDAGVQAALMLYSPAKALKALGLGYGAAAAKDFGILPVGSANAADDGLTDDQRKRLATLEKKGSLSRAEREERNKILDMQAAYRSAEARAKFESQVKRDELASEAKAAADADKRAEFSRAVSAAERARDVALARDRRFSDTEVGKVWEKTGGLAPLAFGATLGGLSRAASGGGSTLKDYGLPAIVGGLSGAAASNVPLAYNAFFTEPDNPERKAYEAYSRELPPEHPRKDEWTKYAQGLPKKNPVRDVASEELYDWTKAAERMGFGAIEGIGGGIAGSEVVRLPRRVVQAATSLPGTAVESYHTGMTKGFEAKAKATKSEAKALKADQAASESRLNAADARSSALDAENDAKSTALRLARNRSEAQRRISGPTADLDRQSAGTQRQQRSGEAGSNPSTSVGPSDKSVVVANPEQSPMQAMANAIAEGVARRDEGMVSALKQLTESVAAGNMQSAELLKAVTARMAPRKTAAQIKEERYAPTPEQVATEQARVERAKKTFGNLIKQSDGKASGGSVAPQVFLKTKHPAGHWQMRGVNGKFASGGAVAAALDTARRYANGGRVHVGAVSGATGGREDKLPVSVPAGSFVIPADIVSGLGTGNTEAGYQKLEKMFGKPAASRASGGAVPIKISHGEFVLTPEQVAKVGNGDVDRGHRTLDALVLKLRDHNIKTLAELPPPSK